MKIKKFILELNDREAINVRNYVEAHKLCDKFHELNLTWFSKEYYLHHTFFNVYTSNTLYIPKIGIYKNLEAIDPSIYTIYTINDLLDFEENLSEKEEYIIFTPKNQRDIIDMTYGRWKKKLATIFGYTLALEESYFCSKEEFERFLNASTNAQTKKFKKMFPQYFQSEIKKDTLVYVRDGGLWVMRYFSHFDKCGKIYCFHNQRTSEEARTKAWEEYSLTNPLEK